VFERFYAALGPEGPALLDFPAGRGLPGPPQVTREEGFSRDPTGAQYSVLSLEQGPLSSALLLNKAQFFVYSFRRGRLYIGPSDSPQTG
jgi:hypothetical protein